VVAASIRREAHFGSVANVRRAACGGSVCGTHPVHPIPAVVDGNAGEYRNTGFVGASLAKPVPVLLMSRELGVGGTERQLTETAKALDRSRIDPHVACFHAEGFRADELRRAGIPILQLPVTSFLSSSALRGAAQLGRYLEKYAIQLVHTWDMPLAIYGVPVARLFGTGRVLSSQRCYRALASPLEHHLLRMTDRMVDGIVVNSNAVRADLIEQDRVPANLIHLCHNGIDTGLFHPPENRCGDSITIGTVCALRPEKSLETLIEAFAALPARPNVKLAIVGNGEMRKPLERLAAGLGLNGRCAFEPA